MKLLKLILSALFALAFFSCEKAKITPEETAEEASLFPIIAHSTPRHYDAHISIQAASLYSASANPSRAYINAHFWNSDRRAVKVGGVSAEGIDLELYERTLQNSINVGARASDTLETFISAFHNKEMSIQVEGGHSGFSDLEANVPLPSLIASEEPIDSINKSEPLTLSWKKAGDNSTEPVGITISYDPSYYANRISTAPLPEESAFIIRIIDEGNDNSVTFTPEELDRFPANGHVRLKISRGVQTFIEREGKTFLITGKSLVMQSDVFISKLDK